LRKKQEKFGEKAKVMEKNQPLALLEWFVIIVKLKVLVG
jgi:hypothetical protein